MSKSIVEEMKRYLPVIEALENEPELWNRFTKGTGIATANGYRNAISKFKESTDGEVDSPIEEPYFDKYGNVIKEFAVLKVFHFIGARRKKHYMYKWVRLIEYDGKKYWYAQHLTDNTAFFEKGSNKTLTGYGLRSCSNPDDRRLKDTEIVQQYD
jgi:hypothetical protein